jgi:hypothetical protein
MTFLGYIPIPTFCSYHGQTPSSQTPSCNGVDTAKDTRERRLTRGTMEVVRKADDGLSSGILFSSIVGVAMQQVVLCSGWCASRGQPDSTPSNARTRPVTSSTGKRSAVKVACCVWAGGKSVSSYLSVQTYRKVMRWPPTLLISRKVGGGSR